ncbi:hypothetical protein [Dactylosporangium sp. NPDC005555]|uniref:hypothetical protein n=1 Tax=Dactylosporangium sp. NPDC005555 TaxID=3154889 RepID=UPI0033A6E90B
MTGTPAAAPTLIQYDSTGYPMLPATAPAPRVLRPVDGGTGNRRRRGIRSVAGAVAMLLVAGVAVRCSGIGPTDSPESIVRAVFAALTVHDGQQLDRLGWCERSPLCSADGLTTGYQAPEQFDIVSGRTSDDDHRSIRVRYTVNGATAEENVQATRYRSGLLGHRWSISRLPGARIDVRTAASERIHVAGVTLAANPVDKMSGGTEPDLFAPPGAYTVAVDGDALFAVSTATVVIAGGIDPAPTVITPTLRPDLQPQIEQQITDRITYCAGQQEFHPIPPQWRNLADTCPFGHDARTPFKKSPTWTVERLPVITVHVDDHSTVSVRTTSPGVAVVRYQWSVDVVEPRRWTDASTTVEFDVDGQVGVQDNAPHWIG